jgi:hypothetical protein
MDQYPWTIRFRSRTGCCQAISGNCALSSSETRPAASPRTVKFHKSTSRRCRLASSWLTVTPLTSYWACSAVSIISVSRRMSRCIHGPGFGQDGRSQQGMQCAHGYQADPVAEEVGQFVGELLDLPAQPPTGPQRVEDAEIAVRFGVTTGATWRRGRDTWSGSPAGP